MHKENDAPQVSLHPLLVFVVLMLMVLMQMTTDQYVPSLPAITKIFNSNEASIQLTLSLFMLGLGISHVFYGPLSDKIGRKPPLMFGVGLSIAGSLCCFLAPSVPVLIIGRFIQGFGIGCCGSVGRSLVRDLFTDRVLSKIGSYVGIVSVFIMVASPVLGGYIQEQYGWRMNFLFLLVFGIAIWIFALFTLPETNKKLNPDATQFKVMLANYFTLLKSKVFLGYALCACLASAGLIGYLAISPFLFQDGLGLSPIEFGQLTIFIAGAICVSGIINSQLVMSKGVSYMVFIGIILMVSGGFTMLVLTLAGFQNVLSIMIPVSLFSMGVGFTFINAFAGAFHPFPHMAGTVGALYACMQDLSSALSSGIIAMGQWYGQFSLAIILLILGISALASWYYLASKEH
ncbi:multidrug effflux MFS transporter [Fluoribacter dumoffii]|uniref:Bcr/CflA family efflux transporter n=1 Tax=Fluoribacter dumoffii TaxID=463 RepID=A0A377GCL6_9GAMM|nr:multidrug effflux MFS transporter [Fluoribacter dumoffii]KTC90751.1 multidrug resistance protein [Fluoribacter dumoffii NY 23]MCW8419485.1 multidrug effflux MFS transporter [Fluoribacter dumoffii]MCW8452640.1 multidrug effflux MFS transporter [Fluoribacter dumoffii]MCW8460110.1 multidrug effflux MFS transporter [Fluoribacter dumoffii]MCW8483588.1 multidrug effflux MFS transporter [Fluoribacter dumoffii]